VATSDDAHQPPEIDMTTQAKLTDTQTTILKAAAGRPDGNIEPLPPTLRGGARAKVIDGLLARGLIIDADGQHQITDAGYATVGKRRPAPKGVQKMDILDGVAKRDTTHALQKLEATSRSIRPGTKLAAIIDAMRNPGGATIVQMMAGTGWQAHTVRGAISGMVRKRLGLNVTLVRNDSGEPVYRVI
jgi:hypothetical protein